MRQIVDGETRQLLANVYVILSFSGYFFMGVESRLICYRLDVEKTDAEGRFLFPMGSRSLNPLLTDTQVDMTLYKAGYRALDRVPTEGEPVMVVADTRPWRSNPPFGGDAIPMAIMPSKTKPGVPESGTSISPLMLKIPPQERIEGRDANLDAIVSKLDRCGSIADTRKEAVFVAMYNEVRNMDQVDWGFISNLLYEIEKIENGGEVDKYGGGGSRFKPAHEHYEKRETQLRRHSSAIGQGALWELLQTKGEK